MTFFIILSSDCPKLTVMSQYICFTDTENFCRILQPCGFNIFQIRKWGKLYYYTRNNIYQLNKESKSTGFIWNYLLVKIVMFKISKFHRHGSSYIFNHIFNENKNTYNWTKNTFYPSTRGSQKIRFDMPINNRNAMKRRHTNMWLL